MKVLVLLTMAVSLAGTFLLCVALARQGNAAGVAAAGLLNMAAYCAGAGVERYFTAK